MLEPYITILGFQLTRMQIFHDVIKFTKLCIALKKLKPSLILIYLKYRDVSTRPYKHQVYLFVMKIFRFGYFGIYEDIGFW